MNLSSVMEFDHVIAVSDSGTVTDASGVYAPELEQEYVWTTDIWSCDGEPTVSDGWTLLTGYTQQYGLANSAVMHSSEYIGGALERDILSTPGYYVALVIPSAEQMGYSDDDDTAPGWVVAFKPLTEDN